jgi:serine/threonine protein kinase
VIVHGDVHPSQWLRTIKGEVRLNDFNNGMVLDWDGEDYCGETRKFKSGVFHGPENLGEDDDQEVTEMSDIYGYGQTLYTILTGLYPFWEYENESSRVQTNMVVNGTKPIIDSRYRSVEKYPIEGRIIRTL